MIGDFANAERLAAIDKGIETLGKSAADCAQLVAGVTEAPATQEPIRDMKQRLLTAGIPCDDDWLERVLLGHAMDDSVSKIDGQPVPFSVRELIRKQFDAFRKPLASQGPLLDIDAAENDAFIAACKICTLRRFPAGPLDWVVSGMPRSWLLKMSPRDMPRALKFILSECRGFKPFFYVHIAHPPRNRALIIGKEVQRAYYRMAQALTIQKDIKGIMCATWLHDPVAVKMYPYLAPLNEPYLSHGGRLVASLGPAPVSSGFLKFNSVRREQYERGELKLKTVLAMWPRRAAIEWAKNSPHLES